MRVTLTATGSYAASEIKPELVESLRASIEQHMKAYGLKEIAIQSRVLSEPQADEDSQGGQS